MGGLPPQDRQVEEVVHSLPVEAELLLPQLPRGEELLRAPRDVNLSNWADVLTLKDFKVKRGQH